MHVNKARLIADRPGRWMVWERGIDSEWPGRMRVRQAPHSPKAASLPIESLSARTFGVRRPSPVMLRRIGLGPADERISPTWCRVGIVSRLSAPFAKQATAKETLPSRPRCSAWKTYTRLRKD
jgi:hypothetical protein